MPALAPPLVLAFLSFAALSAVALAPPAQGPVAAVFPPSLSQADLFQRIGEADAAIVRYGAFENVVVVSSERPDLAGRLRTAGAWLVLAPIAAFGCLSS